jgi:hypothetical protein
LDEARKRLDEDGLRQNVAEVMLDEAAVRLDWARVRLDKPE